MQLKTFRFILCAIMSFILILPNSSLSISAQSASKHWAADTLNKWEKQGLLTEGYNFDERLTRLGFITLINHVFGLSERSNLSFIDVETLTKVGEIINISATAGYIKGYADGSFRPNQLITREEAAVILVRIFSVSSSENATIFKDDNQLKAWSKAAIYALTTEGYLKGYPDGQFKPGKGTTFAELVTMLDNIVDMIISEPGTYRDLDAKNLLIAAPNVTILNSKIARNVYVSRGAAAGKIVIENSTIGKKVISAAGNDAVSLINTTIGNFTTPSPSQTPAPTLVPPSGPGNSPSPGENHSEFSVSFDLNYEGASVLEPIKVKAKEYIKVESKPAIPVREGYRFAGWHTVKEPILLNGYSNDEWLFGEKYLNVGDFAHIPEDDVKSMPVTKDMVLYARWVLPTEISTIDDLIKINKDLYGWYILKNDIDLSAVQDWNPIGVYHSTYEFANEGWWQLAFRGEFDGNGHSLTGLSINTPKRMAAFFGAISDALVQNLSIENYKIDFTIQDPVVYAAPLVGIAKGGKTKILNVHTDGALDVKLIDDKTTSSFVVAAGLAAGNWSGLVDNSSVQGDITLTSFQNGGEVYVGGIIGEGYGTTVNSTVDANISSYVTSDSPINGAGNQKLEVFVGGIQAGSTYVLNSRSSGEIIASVKKDIGDVSVNVGGISGSGRYGFIENSRSDANITVKEGKKVFAGGIQGSFHAGYGVIGFYYGIKRFEVFNSIATGKITIEDGFSREINGVRLGAIIGEIPTPLSPPVFGGMEAGKVIYRSENSAYVDHYNGEALNDVNKTIMAYPSSEEMKGNALASQLGTDQWNYSNDNLPVPAKRTEWDLNSPRESILPESNESSNQ